MRKTFKAFSLIEMLLTLGIMSIVMLIATQTLNTVFRVSAITQFKTITKNEIGFSVELIERLLANSNVVDVFLFSTEDVREYNETTGDIETSGGSDLGVIYGSAIEDGDKGNELHIRPYGYSLWVCLGYFNGVDNPEQGYLLKRTVTELPEGHQSCFDTNYDTSRPLFILNSDEVKVNDFSISYIKSSNLNNVFYLDLEMEPVHWVPGSSGTIQRSVVRQAIITTQGLTWY